MTGKQWAILLSSVVGAVSGVFLGAGAETSWIALSSPNYIFGSLVAGASATGAFFSKGPSKRQWKGTRYVDGG